MLAVLDWHQAWQTTAEGTLPWAVPSVYVAPAIGHPMHLPVPVRPDRVVERVRDGVRVVTPHCALNVPHHASRLLQIRQEQVCRWC